MPTNKEWLYSLDPHELTEWFESEYDSNDTLGAKKVVSVHTGTANDANVSTHVETANGTSDGARAALDAKFDSREKLEDDVREFFDACYARVVLRFIDRQAAITERECFAMFPDGAVNAGFHREERKRWQAERDELQAQVDELTEQRDRWRENWNRRNVAYSDLVNEYEELRDEKTKLESTLDVILDALADYWLPDER